jgi:predicted negative regulator of RcsB-dependent stress response
MINKSLLSTILVLLVAIAGYLGYLAWDRHQHNLQEEAEQRKELAFDAAMLGKTPAQLVAERKAQGINPASDDAAASAAGLK